MMYAPIKKYTVLLVTTVILFTAAVIGVWRFAVLMQAKKQNVIEAKQQLASYQENKKIFSEELKVVTTISERLNVLEGYRITPATTPDLLSTLEALGKRDGIVFAITSVQTPGTTDKKLLIDFSATGSVQRVDTFLNDLSHQSYEVKFTKFSLFADTSTTDNAVADTQGAPVVHHTQLPQWEVLASIQIVSY